jgi:hypothetical protein
MENGLLKNSYCYLVGPIEYSENCFDWRLAVTESVKHIGIKCFDPNKDHFVNQLTETQKDRDALKAKRESGDWKSISKYMKGVISRDLRMVDLSTFIIGKIDPEVPTFGTIHEIVIASLQNKPILIYTDDKKKFPLWLAGLINMDLVFESWGEIVEYLIKINSKEIYADPKYWKILTNE